MVIGPFEETVVEHGAIGGVLAFLVGLALVAPLVFIAGGPLAEQAAATPLAVIAFEWLFFHAWPVFFGSGAGALVLALFPAGVLTAAGYLIAWRTGELDIPGRYRGPALVFGYLPATAVGFGYAVWRFGSVAGETAGPVEAILAIDPVFLLVAVGYAGVFFPIVFGGLGGHLQARRET